MATDTLEIFGTEYTGVTGIKATDDNGNTKTYIRPQGTLSISANGTGIDCSAYAEVDVAVPAPAPTLQSKSKTYTPTTSQQTESVTPDTGNDGLSAVNITVNAMPTGSATAPATISGTSATVSTGTNTLTLSKTVSVTPSVSAGYVASGTAGNSSVSLTASVNTKAAATITPGTSDQTIASGTYLTGAQTIEGDANLVAGNIKSGTTIFGVTGNYTGGGGGIGTLLTTTSLGELSTTSTQATDTTKTVSVSNATSYDYLIAVISRDTVANSYHIATVSTIYVVDSSGYLGSPTSSIGSNKWNYTRRSSAIRTYQGTTAYGVYANTPSISGTTLTFKVYYRYNSTNTGSINGNYTARVYGIKLREMINGY